MDIPFLTFIGAGNMASSLIGGLVERGHPADYIMACDPLGDYLERMQHRFGILTSTDNINGAARADVLVLAVKPQILERVCRELSGHIDHKPLVVSIAAGVPLASLSAWLGDELPLVRCMPNTPSLLQQGASGLFANDIVSEDQRQQAEGIMASVGIVEWVRSEDEIDAVTALSGSGPAYYFLFMEIMEKVGIELGLDPQVARRLTRQTALGAARMGAAENVEVAELRRQVTSPGGTTAQAIESFMSSNLEQVFRDAMGAALQRARDMAQEGQPPV